MMHGNVEPKFHTKLPFLDKLYKLNCVLCKGCLQYFYGVRNAGRLGDTLTTSLNANKWHIPGLSDLSYAFIVSSLQDAFSLTLYLLRCDGHLSTYMAV